MTRVQIPAYMDRWIMGDRFGEIIKVTKSRRQRLRKSWDEPLYNVREIAHVKLDISGKVVRVLLDDCKVV